MKVRIEIAPDSDEEIIIKCRCADAKAELTRTLIEGILCAEGELLLYLGNTEYYVKKDDILFFEISDGKVFAHTLERMLRANYKLFELENILPSYFVRISKSAIANVKLISSLSRELTGNGTLTFKATNKQVYFSRAYHKQLKDKIEEVKL